jgi:hypothetical protein
MSLLLSAAVELPKPKLNKQTRSVAYENAVKDKHISLSNDARTRHEALPTEVGLDNLFHCPDCPYKTQWKRILSKHWNHHHLKPLELAAKHRIVQSLVKQRLACDECDFVCSRKSALLSHKSTNHPRVKVEACSKCKFTSTDEHQVFMHELHHDDAYPLCKEKSFLCPFCRKYCALKSDFLEHVQTHRVSPSEGQSALLHALECVFCDQQTNVPGLLADHIVHAHRPTAAFQCPECPVTAGSRAELEVHTAGAHDDACLTYVCPEDSCSKRFALRNSLQVHAYEHKAAKTGESSPYATSTSAVDAPVAVEIVYCVFCEEKCANAEHLISHIRVNHLVKNPELRTPPTSSRSIAGCKSSDNEPSVRSDKKVKSASKKIKRTRKARAISPDSSAETSQQRQRYSKRHKFDATLYSLINDLKTTQQVAHEQQRILMTQTANCITGVLRDVQVSMHRATLVQRELASLQIHSLQQQQQQQQQLFQRQPFSSMARSFQHQVNATKSPHYSPRLVPVAKKGNTVPAFPTQLMAQAH